MGSPAPGEGNDMQYTLAGVGETLGHPVVLGVMGTLDSALKAAEDILQVNPHCESVEIFRNREFLREVERRLH